MRRLELTGVAAVCLMCGVAAGTACPPYRAGAADARTWRVEPETPLEEVNAWDVRPGDAVLFRRGGVWRGTLKPRSGRPGAPVVYSFFGEGAKPQLSCCVRVADRDGWLSANHDRADAVSAARAYSFIYCWQPPSSPDAPCAPRPGAIWST